MLPFRNKYGWMTLLLCILPTRLAAQDQEPDRVQVLTEDIQQLGKRAVQDRIISEEERQKMLDFVRDSLPEDTPLKIKAMEQIRDELDEKYAEAVRQAQTMLDEAGYLCREMMPSVLYIPDDYISPEEMRMKQEQAAVAGAAIDAKEILKYVKPLPMKPWLRTILRLLFGHGVNQRPERWDYYTVPQMGGVYSIIMPGGRPDDSWRDAPPMYYDPHPDKHFRH